MKRILFTTLLFIINSDYILAQVGVGTITPHESAILEVKSNEKGFLLPRVNNSNLQLINSPAEGLMVYNTDEKCLSIFKQSNWYDVCTNNMIVFPIDFSTVTPIKIDAGTDGNEQGFFGDAISISADGNTVLVGSHGDDDQGIKAGSAYIYKLSGGSWNKTEINAGPEGDDFHAFGDDVSISADGNTVLVGASGYLGIGAAYVFKHDNGSWIRTRLNTGTELNTNDYFGSAVSISADGNTAIVSSPGDDDHGSNTGAVYVFKFSGGTWNRTKITAGSDAGADDGFGSDVSISADGATILVGASSDDDLGSKSGTAFIFKYSGGSWNKTKIDAGTDGDSEDYFGNSVSLSDDGNTALIGAYLNDDQGTSSGSAYIFKYSGGVWNRTKIDAGSDGAANHQFGDDVSINANGNTALIGAIGDNPQGNFSGSAYIFRYDGSSWAKTKINAGSLGGTPDQFGSSVSISGDGNTAVIGAPWDSQSGGQFSGSAYILKE